ncbi:hypothetical protein [Sulfurimonas sp. HSL3-7]|uniref:hypothetical protein n=1 Tax=Sulfonitrofixus jiaomeiensis TaxID=3131938 RepID=UPI0031F75907
MKLRSIVTAGLLGAGLLTMSGCDWFEDKAEEIVEDALKPNVIHLANGQTSLVEFTIEGDSHFVDGFSSDMVPVTGHDTYTVNNTVVDHPVDFPKNSAHLYALCATDNVITDSATTGSRQIEVINLSNTVIDAGSGKTVTVTLYNSSDAAIASASLAGQTLAVCSRAELSFPSFTLSDVKTVEVNDVNYTVPPYDADIATKLDQINDVDFDIVVFDTTPGSEKGTIVPLATTSDLEIL